MKFKVCSLSLVILVQLFLPVEVDAFTRRVTDLNRSLFKPISGLKAYGLTAVCYRYGNYGALGSIRRGFFRSPLNLRGVGRKALTSKRFKITLAGARRRCRKDETPPPPTPTPTPTFTATIYPTPLPSPTRIPTSSPTPFVTPTPPEIPQRAQWEAQMINFGMINCNRLKSTSLSFDEKLAATYYDAEWVFYRIGDYTGDPIWYSCAQAAEAVYSQRYVLGSNGTVPGYWNFSHGVTRDYLSTGDGSSQNATVLLSRNAAFAVDSTPLSSTVDAAYSREVAYTIMSYLNAEQVGEGHRSRTEALVGQALGHMDQWFVSRTAPYVRPFMFALTAHALISYYEQIGGNPNILPGIARGADWIWNNTWLPGSQAFKYTDRVVSSGGTEPAPDLNLLIAPVYAWLWHQTGNPVYRDRADQIFAGGVDGAYLHNGKQFNQNYRWSFDFIRWRSIAPRR